MRMCNNRSESEEWLVRWSVVENDDCLIRGKWSSFERWITSAGGGGGDAVGGGNVNELSVRLKRCFSSKKSRINQTHEDLFTDFVIFDQIQSII